MANLSLQTPQPLPTQARNQITTLMDVPVEITIRSGEFLLSPKYSLLVNGIKCIMDDVAGGGHSYLKGFGTAIGGLMIMASPVWGMIRISVGVPGVVLGTAATILSGAAYGVGWTIRKVFRLQEPSNADRQRLKLTKLFVTRLDHILSGLSYPQTLYFREHPDQLISIGLITVAFLSRKHSGRKLVAGDKILDAKDILEQDATRQGYFDGVCEIRNAIQSLMLGDDDETAWKTFVEEIQTPPADQIRRDTIGILTGVANSLGETIATDEVFVRLWNQK